LVDVEAAYRRYFPVIREKCRRMLFDLAEADDAAQETFVRLWKARLKDSDPRRLVAWIYRTSTRIAIDRLRRRAARMSMNEAMDRLACIPAGPDEALAARRALELVSRTLPATELEIAVLHRLDGLTLAQVAEVAEISARTVRRFLERLDKRVETLRKESGL
jgi:RNA polymerase sigma-70 factor (ECF subfamily)